jgi:hypothetical protein
MSIRDYTVIVYPPPPVMRGAGQVYSNAPGSANGPRVVKVTSCKTPQEAAAKADVVPGGRCTVVVESRSYQRPAQASLEETDERGQALPIRKERPADAA